MTSGTGVYWVIYSTAYTPYTAGIRAIASGVTTDPADPAMRGGGAMRGSRGPMGAQNCGISFFTENLTQQFSCGRALPSLTYC